MPARWWSQEAREGRRAIHTEERPSRSHWGADRSPWSSQPASQSWAWQLGDPGPLHPVLSTVSCLTFLGLDFFSFKKMDVKFYNINRHILSYHISYSSLTPCSSMKNKQSSLGRKLRLPDTPRWLLGHTEAPLWTCGSCGSELCPLR